MVAHSRTCQRVAGSVHKHTRKHAQTCTPCWYSGTVWHCRCTGKTHTHTRMHSLFLLWSQREHTDLISPQLARLVGDQQSSPPVSPNRAYQSTHSLCVSVSLSFCALHLFESVCMFKCRISSKVYSYIVQGCSSALVYMVLITQDHVHKTFITCTLQCHSSAKEEPLTIMERKRNRPAVTDRDREKTT